jgi:hypothetical protein
MMKAACSLLAVLAAGVFGPGGVEGQTAHVAGVCGWDLNSDGLVSTNDLLYLLAVFGDDVGGNPSVAIADGNGDGRIGTNDLLGLLAFFGRSCEDLAAPPPPAPVTPEAAAAEFEAALAAVANDPTAPLVAIASVITFEGDVSMVAEGQARDEFEESFTINMAASFGDGAQRRASALIWGASRAGRGRREWKGREGWAAAATTPHALLQLYKVLRLTRLCCDGRRQHCHARNGGRGRNTRWKVRHPMSRNL